MRLPYSVTKWFSYSEWRFLVRRVAGVAQRSQRGWAPIDTWGMDSYLATVIAGMLKHLAETTHGYPTNIKGVESFEDWRALLLDLSAAFTHYTEMWDGPNYEGMTHEQFAVARNAWEADYDATLLKMARLIEVWPALWD